jgi:hypothetical protein
MNGPIVTPAAARVEGDRRRKLGHQFQIGAGLGKAAEELAPYLVDGSREQAVNLVRMAALHALSYALPEMTLDEAKTALMEAR